MAQTSIALEGVTKQSGRVTPTTKEFAMYVQFCSLTRHDAFHLAYAYRAYYKKSVCYLDYWNGTKWITIDVSPYHTDVAEFIQYEFAMGL